MALEQTKVRLVGIVALWLVTVWEFLTMGIAGLAKFGPAEVWLRWFETWGYASWFLRLIGSLELVGAVLLLVPAVAPYAAAALLVVMFGALFTILTNEHGPFTVSPILIHIVGLSIVLWFRRPAALRKLR